MPCAASRPDARLAVRDLARAMAALPVPQWEVVALVGVEGLGYAEAAGVLGISVGTVKSRLARGRRALQSHTDGPREATGKDSLAAVT